MTYLDLRTIGFQRQRIVRACTLRWAIVLLVSLPVGAIFIGEQWRRERREAALLEAMEAQYRPIQKLQAANATLQAQIDTMHQRQAIALTLYEEKPLLALLGVVSRAARDNQGQVFIKQFHYGNHLQASQENEPADASNQVVSRLDLSGVGVDNVAVAQFAAAIRDMHLFKKVELKSSGTTQLGTMAAKSFKLECEL